MKKSIKVNDLQLSQYHAGQAVERSASIVRDHEGVWYSVVTVNDPTTGWPQHTVKTHEAQEEANQAIEDAGLIVDCDYWHAYDLSHVKRVADFCSRHEYRFSMEINPAAQTVEVRVGGRTEAFPFSRLDKIVPFAKQTFADAEFGRDYGDEFVLDRKAMDNFHRDLARL